MKRSFSLFICVVLAAITACGQLRICGSCGREDTAGGARCTVCQELLPPIVTTEPPAVVETPVPTDNPVSSVAFEAVRQDVLMAREEEARRPEVALALYENAQALLAVADSSQLPPEAGRAVLAGIQRCRAALAVTGQSCPACNGTGRQQITLLQLAGGSAAEAAAPTRATGAICATCGGRGALVGQRDIEATRLLILRGRREAGLKLQAIGRVAAGRAWVPREWLETVTPMQIAAVRRVAAAGCPACAGIGLETCRKCSGTATQPCPNRACRDGWIEQKPTNTLTPKSALTRRVPCPVCQGKSRIACATCRSTGGVACEGCHGTGLAAPCRSCNGEGTVVCRTCQSTRPATAGKVCAACKGCGRMLCARCSGDGVVTK